MVVESKRCKVPGKEYGDGSEWYRGSLIGRGNSARVFLASPRIPNLKLHNKDEKERDFPSQMAIKSADSSFARSLRDEAEVFSDIGACPYIVTCFGNEMTIGQHAITYNLLLEYGSGGTLADKINKSGCGLPESEVKLYTWSILKGLCHIHQSGYIHCDLKPENIFLVASEGGFTAKIGDLGLAMKESESKIIKQKIVLENKKKLAECAFVNKKRKFSQLQPCPYWRGTFNYMSPEAVIGAQFFSSDVWSLGCTVLEMLKGKPAWQQKRELSIEEVVDKIRTKGEELPEIPDEISEEAKSFLKLCLVRLPLHRSSAESLLQHSFFEGIKL